jgi:hypothetical protein
MLNKEKSINYEKILFNIKVDNINKKGNNNSEKIILNIIIEEKIKNEKKKTNENIQSANHKNEIIYLKELLN